MAFAFEIAEIDELLDIDFLLPAVTPFY